MQLMPGIDIHMTDKIVGYNPDAPQYHNAGYDAYATGCVFARQVQRFFSNTSSSTAAPGDDVNSGSGGFNIPPAAQSKCCNKICATMSFYNINLNPAEAVAMVALSGLTVRITHFSSTENNYGFITPYFRRLGFGFENCRAHFVDENAFFLNFPNVSLGPTSPTPSTIYHRNNVFPSYTSFCASIGWPKNWIVESWPDYRARIKV